MSEGKTPSNDSVGIAGAVVVKATSQDTSKLRLMIGGTRTIKIDCVLISSRLLATWCPFWYVWQWSQSVVQCCSWSEEWLCYQDAEKDRLCREVYEWYLYCRVEKGQRRTSSDEFRGRSQHAGCMALKACTCWLLCHQVDIRMGASSRYSYDNVLYFNSLFKMRSVDSKK